jgi:hypothetical protein
MRKVVVNLIRGQVVKRLMKAISVIKVEPVAETVPKIGSASRFYSVGKKVIKNALNLGSVNFITGTYYFE